MYGRTSLLEARGLYGYYTYHHDHLACSPAIDAGDPTGCVDKNGSTMNYDQCGEAHQVGSRCDIGAVESATGKWWLFLTLIMR